MGNINYSKAEKEVEKAVQDAMVKNLAEGKPVASSHAIRYFAIDDDSPRPPLPDSVEKLMSETAAEEEKVHQTAETTPVQTDDDLEEEEEFEIIEHIPESDVVKKARKQSSRIPKREPLLPKKSPPSEKYTEATSPLLILRKHILWFKRQHMDDRYEQLGTTKEEVFAFRRARRLTDVDIQRIKELNVRAEKLKNTIMEKKGVSSLEENIEKETKRHKHKRFNTRETWLQL